MTKTEICSRIQQIGVIPAVWVSSEIDAHFAADTLCGGGIPILEITMLSPEEIEYIAHITQHHQDKEMIVGAGTIVDVETARRTVDAGARFLTGPGFDPEILAVAARNDVVYIPGALTPTEIVKASRAGSDFVKVFPCAQVGGDKYIKALKRSLPQIPMVASGGVTQRTAEGFILAGACALGVGTDLIPPDAITRRQVERIHELSRRFLEFVKAARERLEDAKPRKPAVKS